MKIFLRCLKQCVSMGRIRVMYLVTVSPVVRGASWSWTCPRHSKHCQCGPTATQMSLRAPNLVATHFGAEIGEQNVLLCTRNTQSMPLNPKHCACGLYPLQWYLFSNCWSFSRPLTLWIFWYSLVKGWRILSIFFPWQGVSLKSTSWQATERNTFGLCLWCHRLHDNNDYMIYLEIGKYQETLHILHS